MYSVGDKLIARGVEALTDCELLALLFGDDASSMEQAQLLLDRYNGSLANIASEDLARLRMVEGVGLKRANRLAVAVEWGRRTVLATTSNQIVISTSADVVKIFRPLLEGLKQEECWVLFLNASNRVVEQRRFSQGGIVATVVDHRLIIKRALELLATHIVVVHNHPSGSIEPSEADLAMTQKIKSAAALFDIKLLDHLILSAEGDFSLLSAGLL